MSFVKQSTIKAAYATLGLAEGAPIEEVKATYKKIALRTHPDKNPGNADATTRFQEVSQAYDTIQKHLSRPQGGQRGHMPFGFSPFGAYDDSDDYSDEDEEYYDSDDEFLEAYFMYMFEQAMKNRFGFGGHRGFRREAKARKETPQDYTDRLRRQREEQEAAARRREQETQRRKERAARDRELERQAAEKRQQAKIAEKKAKAEAQRQAAEEAAYNQAKQVQTARTAAFAAARAGNSDSVKKGVWENSVDPSGGEVKPGKEKFVTQLPKDRQETLLHIAAKNGDVDLVKWLDAHSADPEERNAEGLTAFHLALHRGHIPVVSHFLETYPPKEEESQNIYSMDASKSSRTVLSFAVESREPEVVYFILDNGLAQSQDIKRSWTWATSAEGQKAMKPKKLSPVEIEKVEDISKLLIAYGNFTPPSTPYHKSEHSESESANSSPLPPSHSNVSPPSQKNSRPNRGRGRGRGGRARGRR